MGVKSPFVSMLLSLRQVVQKKETGFDAVTRSRCRTERILQFYKNQDELGVATLGEHSWIDTPA